MIRAGLVEEGLKITQAVRGRYAGYNRNPYAEIESGYYYSRALSSWSVLLALSGFEYDGPGKSIRFNPAISHSSFSSFWSAGSAWGNYGQTNHEISLEVDYGSLALRQLSHDCARKGSIPSVELNGSPVDCHSDGEGSLTFHQTLALHEGDVLKVTY